MDRQRLTGQKRCREMWCLWSGSTTHGITQKNTVRYTILINLPEVFPLPPPPKKSKSKIITWKSNNPTPTTPQPNTIRPHWNVKAPLQIKKFSKSSTTSHVTFTYPTNTPKNTLTKIHAFIHSHNHISENNCGATGHHATKA